MIASLVFACGPTLAKDFQVLQQMAAKPKNYRTETITCRPRLRP